MTQLSAENNFEVPMSPDFDQIREWLEIVYSETPGHVNICSTADWTGRFYDLRHGFDDALHYIKELDAADAQGIYLRTTTLKTVPTSGRGSDGDSHFLPGLWADLDIAGPGHKSSKPLPPNINEAMRIVEESGLPEPSHWIHSGGGLYAWWLLHHPAEISVSNVEDMRKLSAQWQKVLSHTAEKIGYSYGAGVGDLSRVLRIPGTVNRKAGLQRPCTGLDGRAWSGQLYELEDLSMALSEALARIPSPEPVPMQSKLSQRFAQNGTRPGDEYNAKTDWADILAPLGWTHVYTRGDESYLRRPGKNDGTSATLRHSTGKLYVFSDATEFEPNKAYSKFEAYTLLNHGGDYSAAARELGRAGFGDRSADYPRMDSKFWADLETGDDTSGVSTGTMALTSSGDLTDPPSEASQIVEAEVVEPKRKFTEYNETGQGIFMAEKFGDKFRFVHEELGWRVYAEGVWAVDSDRELRRAAQDVTLQYMRECDELFEEAVQSQDKARIRKASKIQTSGAASRSDRGHNACINKFADQKGVAVKSDAFDANLHLLALGNGTFDLKTMTLREHRPEDMLTKRLPVDYDPSATAPRWEQALEQWVPDPIMRDYLQRAVGYTLTGDVDQGAFFVLHGDTGCGKSQFSEVIGKVFGELGTTAATTTFRAARYGEKAGFDLHALRGARYVATSETSEGTQIDEELIKRVTGDDMVTSCAKFEKHVSWKPRFVPWVLTNFLPKMNHGDSAIWRRVKPIHFPNSFFTPEREEAREVGLGKKLIDSELAGIFNWVIEGVRKYREHGLKDPEQLRQDVADYRADSDPVQTFLTNAAEEGVIERDENKDVRSSELYRVYCAWSQNNGTRPVGESRFGRHLTTLGVGTRKGAGGVRYRTGIGLNPNGWLAERQQPAVKGEQWWQRT